ncbi:MAG: hypothetical protein R3F30_03980 [Planctomycetota bacterium]
MKPAVRFQAMLAVAFVGLAALLLLRSPDPTPVGVQAEGTGVQAPSPQPESGETASSERIELPAEPVLTLLVVDPTGSPVPGATIHEKPEEGTRLEPMSGYFAAQGAELRSGADGQIDLSQALFADAWPKGHRVWILATGYRPASLELTPARASYRVILDKGLEASFRFVDEDDRPVPGICVRLIKGDYSTSDDLAVASSGAWVGADPGRISFVAKTDEQGVVGFHELEAADYYVDVVGDGLLLVPDNRLNRLPELVRPPIQRKTYRMLRPYGYVVGVKDDEVLRGWSERENTGWDTTYFWRPCFILRRSLERRFPGTFIDVRVRQVGREPNLKTEIGVLARERGWVTGTVEYLPLDRIGSPQYLESDAIPKWGKFVLEVVGPKGEEVGSTGDFRLTWGSAPSSQADFHLEAGKPVAVPPGDYLVRTPSFWPRGRQIQQQVRVPEGGTGSWTLVLPGDLLPNDIEVTLPSGVVPAGGYLGFSAPGASGGTGLGYRPGTKAITLWLPPGCELEFDARSFSYCVMGKVRSNAKGYAPEDRRIRIQLR